MSVIDMRDNSELVRSYAYEKAVKELLDDPIQQENASYFAHQFGSPQAVTFALLVRDQCLKFCSIYPQFLGIVLKCLFVEGREEKNARGTFAELICDFELIREENFWPFDATFTETDLLEYFPHFRREPRPNDETLTSG